MAVETESGKEAYCEGFSMRASERVRVNVSVAYSLDPPHPSGQEIETFHSGTLLDIGDRGLCFKARGYFPVGRMLLLKLKLVDHTDAIRMLGTTVWTSSETDGSTRVGARFIGALPSDWRKLLSNDT
ncbi:PilZ domain-containing protein [Candidatus Sumerlaeota bacterium]|nr:PilZ domain-containing protein [Candidatus Sumerlaeota bacterium]